MNLKRLIWRLLLGGAATAAAALWAAHAATTSNADTERIAARLQKLSPNIKIDSISRVEAAGWYEVVSGDRLFYVDPTARFVMEGSLIDIDRRINLSEARLQEINKVAFAALPKADAIVSVKGRGERKLAIFSDPDCPYCRKLERELAKLDNVTIYTYLMPLVSIHPDAQGRAVSVWCAPDRERAWATAMQGGALAPAHCATPIERNLKLGARLGINGTPTLIFADGRRVPGAIPSDQIEQLLR